MARPGRPWRSAIIALPLGIVSFTVTVVLWSVGLAGVTFPLYGWSLRSGDRRAAPERRRASGRRSSSSGLVGLAVLLVTPFVVRGMAVVNRSLVRGAPRPRRHRGAAAAGGGAAARAARRRSTRPRPSAGASSGTCTTVPSSGWWRWPWTSAWPRSAWSGATIRPYRGPGRTRPRRGQAGDHRAARAGPRHPSGGAGRPRPRRRAVVGGGPLPDPGRAAGRPARSGRRRPSRPRPTSWWARP